MTFITNLRYPSMFRRRAPPGNSLYGKITPDIISLIGLLLIVVGGVVLLYEEGEKNYERPDLIKAAIVGIIAGVILLSIGLA